MDRPIAGDALSRDPEVARAYCEDPAVLRQMTIGMGAGFLSAVERTRAASGRVRVPMLLLHGGDDPLCLPEGSRLFFEGLCDAASDLRIYPGLRHEIFNEPEREAVFEDLLGWMRRAAPPLSGEDGGSAPASGASLGGARRAG
jgi:alpha-beta hydrolase superfamily lysophospholipase